MAEKKESTKEFIEKTTKELFDLVGIDAQIDVEEKQQDEETTFAINIEAPDSTGLLIGAHGSTLNAIQVFLGMALRQETGDWSRVTVNIGDWQEKQEEQLSELAEQTASRAISTEQAQNLYNLTPSQRRIIHLILSKNDKVETESEGEGAERHLVIKPKK